MKKLFIAMLMLPMAVLAQTITPPMRIVSAEANVSPLSIVCPTNQADPLIVAKSRTTSLFSVSASGGISAAGAIQTGATTNQIVFGGTNTAPANTTNVATWISVQVSGDTNVYRLQLQK